MIYSPILCTAHGILELSLDTVRIEAESLPEAQHIQFNRTAIFQIFKTLVSSTISSRVLARSTWPKSCISVESFRIESRTISTVQAPNRPNTKKEGKTFYEIPFSSLHLDCCSLFFKLFQPSPAQVYFPTCPSQNSIPALFPYSHIDTYLLHFSELVF